LRKHIRRINKSLKQCQVAKKLNLKIKALTADILFPLVKDGKITYPQVKSIDAKKFEDLEHTMRMIFNHEDGQQVTQRGIIAAAHNRRKVEKQLEEMRERERQEEEENLHKGEDGESQDDEDDASMAEVVELSEKPRKRGQPKAQEKDSKKSKALTGQKRGKAVTPRQPEEKQDRDANGGRSRGAKRQKISEDDGRADETESEDIDGDESNDDDEDDEASSGAAENDRDAEMSEDSQLCPAGQEEGQDDAEQHSQASSTLQNESKEQFSIKKKNKKANSKQYDTMLKQMVPASMGAAPLNPFGGIGSVKSFNQIAGLNMAS